MICSCYFCIGWPVNYQPGYLKWWESFQSLSKRKQPHPFTERFVQMVILDSTCSTEFQSTESKYVTLSSYYGNDLSGHPSGDLIMCQVRTGAFHGLAYHLLCPKETWPVLPLRPSSQNVPWESMYHEQEVSQRASGYPQLAWDLGQITKLHVLVSTSFSQYLPEQLQFGLKIQEDNSV